MLISSQPCAFLAGDYILLGRLVQHLDAPQYLRPFKPGVVSWSFIGSDSMSKGTSFSYMVQLTCTQSALSSSKRQAEDFPFPSRSKQPKREGIYSSLVSLCRWLVSWCSQLYGSCLLSEHTTKTRSSGRDPDGRDCIMLWDSLVYVS
jgi:hypothetical protein